MKRLEISRKVRCRGRPLIDCACRAGPPDIILKHNRDGPSFSLGRGQPEFSARDWLWFSMSGIYSRSPDGDDHIFVIRQNRPFFSARDWPFFTYSGKKSKPPGRDNHFIIQSRMQPCCRTVGWTRETSPGNAIKHPGRVGYVKILLSKIQKNLILNLFANVARYKNEKSLDWRNFILSSSLIGYYAKKKKGLPTPLYIDSFINERILSVSMKKKQKPRND